MVECKGDNCNGKVHIETCQKENGKRQSWINGGWVKGRVEINEDRIQTKNRLWMRA